MLASLLPMAIMVAPAHALSGNDYLFLVLANGVRVKGWYYDSKDGVLTVSGDSRLFDVPIVSVASVVRNGEPWPVNELLAEVAIKQANEDAWRADPPPHPPGWIPVAGNLVCCGLGHATIGDSKGFARYAVVDAIFLGAATWAVVDGPGWGLAAPVLGLDLMFRGYAAADAMRTTQRRRARLGLREQRGVDNALPRTSVSGGLTDAPAGE